MVKPIAVLFDIDETLVHTGGAGARSWAWAFDQLYGVPADIGEHTSAGETDPQVGRSTFRAVLGREPSYDEMARLYGKYLWHLSEDIWTSLRDDPKAPFGGPEDTYRLIRDRLIDELPELDSGRKSRRMADEDENDK